MFNVFFDKFEDKYKLTDIRHELYREWLETALEYRRALIKLRNFSFGNKRRVLQARVKQMQAFIIQMYELAMHIDGFEGNELIHRDKKIVPKRIAEVKFKIGLRTNQHKLDELQRQLRLLEQQKANLEQTLQSIKSAKEEIHSLFASIEAIYAETMA